jgi:hypothetical protein
MSGGQTSFCVHLHSINHQYRVAAATKKRCPPDLVFHPFQTITKKRKSQKEFGNKKKMGLHFFDDVIVIFVRTDPKPSGRIIF